MKSTYPGVDVNVKDGVIDVSLAMKESFLIPADSEKNSPGVSYTPVIKKKFYLEDYGLHKISDININVQKCSGEKEAVKINECLSKGLPYFTNTIKEETNKKTITFESKQSFLINGTLGKVKFSISA